MTDILCPKCKKGYMEEDDQSEDDMSEGQEADYMAGFNHSCTCSACGFNDLFDVGMSEPDFDDDEVTDEINLDVFEDLVDRVIRKRCFVEVISLVHNYIEYSLYDLLIQNILSDDADLQMKIDLLSGNGRDKSLKVYNELCFISGLIIKDRYEQIKKFNEGRNLVIHRLMHQKTIKSGKNRYGEVVKIAMMGRKIQMNFQQYSKGDIISELKKFEISEEEASQDVFLSK